VLSASRLEQGVQRQCRWLREELAESISRSENKRRCTRQYSKSRVSRISSFREQLAGDGDVEFHGVLQFFFGDKFALGVGDVNGAGADQQRAAPVSKRGNIGSEGGDHGGKAVGRVQFQKRNVENEMRFGEIAGSGSDFLF